MLICRWIVAEKALDKSLWSDALDWHRHTIYNTMVCLERHRRQHSHHIAVKVEQHVKMRTSINEMNEKNYANAGKNLFTRAKISRQRRIVFTCMTWLCCACEAERSISLTCNQVFTFEIVCEISLLELEFDLHAEQKKHTPHWLFNMLIMCPHTKITVKPPMIICGIAIFNIL